MRVDEKERSTIKRLHAYCFGKRHLLSISSSSHSEFTSVEVRIDIVASVSEIAFTSQSATSYRPLWAIPEPEGD